MIEGNSDIKNVFSADVASSLWRKSTLPNDQAIKWTKARVYVYSDSVICLEKMLGPEDAIKRWNDQVSTLKMCHTFRELHGLDGEPIDFEWKIFPLDFSTKFRQDLQGKHVTPETFSDRKIFMSMFNEIDQEKRGNEDACAITSRKIKQYASKTQRWTQVVSRICHQLWWQMGSSCFTVGGKIRRFRTPGTPWDDSAGPKDIRKEK